MIYLYIAVALEMTVVNLIPINLCFRRRKSKFVTIAILALSSAVIFGVGLPLLGLLPFYGNGNGLFVLLAFFYLIPIKFLYDAPLRKILAVMCNVWSLTLVIFSFSVLIAQGQEGIMFPVTVLGVQTVLLLIGTPLFLKFIKNSFNHVLDSHDRKIEIYLLLSCIMWFLTILCVHFCVIVEGVYFLKLVIAPLFMINIFVAVSLLKVMTDRSHSFSQLQETVYLDSLTELKNRLNLNRDLEHLLEQTDIQFTLYFMDLDKFKSVNDNWGHLAGDAYLQLFAKTTSQLFVNENEALYRISGDEFIGISMQKDNICKDIIKINHNCKQYSPAFLGVSVGIARRTGKESYEELLKKADADMYRKKACVEKQKASKTGELDSPPPTER